MAEFITFKQAVKRQCDSMVADGGLFRVNLDKDALWQLYLDSFPEGENELFRERTVHDCNACKSFIRRAGGMVSIRNNQVVTVWDGDYEYPYSEVAKALSEYVKQFPISDIFLSKEKHLGMDKNRHLLEDGTVETYQHLHFLLPNTYVAVGSDSAESRMGKARDTKNVFKRSLDELTLVAGETVLELIEQGSLYSGDQHRGVVQQFIKTKKDYSRIPDSCKDNWCWLESKTNPLGRVRNTALGTLLIDLSADMDLDEAVTKFERVMAPTNYKRPKAIYTKKMVEQAQEKIKELGFEDSLARRQATLDDIRVGDVLFLNRDEDKPKRNIFDELADSVAVDPKKLSKVEEVSVEDFITKILPKAESVEVLVETQHQGNLCSLVAPKNTQAPSMLKWNNNFSWSYNGDLADSMKQNVKAAGGDVDGALRFSIQWNDNDDNHDDLDAHCRFGNSHIYYGNKGRRPNCRLDVDIIDPNGVAVENITFTNEVNVPKNQEIEFFVNCFTHRRATSGFSAEIEFMGQIWRYEYPRPLHQDQNVTVAKCIYTKEDGFQILSSLEGSSHVNSKEIWGIKTNTFVPVKSVMLSPNYWEGSSQTGNKHFLFFLKEDLNPHRRVFEALGGKMKVEEAENHLAGLGFSSTQRNTIIARVKGNFTREIKIKV
jgi:hypothetical protein